MSQWLAATLLASPPSSVGERLKLDWAAPDGCPTQSEIRHAIDRYLGRDEFGNVLESVDIAGIIRSSDSERWRLEIEIRRPGATVQRTVDAPGCHELANAAGLIIAVALDPLRVAQVVVPKKEESRDEGPVPAPAAAEPEAKRFGLDLRVGAALEIGALPRLGAGTSAALALVGPRFRVEASGKYWFPSTIRPFAAAPGAGADTQRGGVALRACFVPTAGRFEFPSCLAAEAGAMRAEGIGLTQSKVSHQPWVAAIVGQELVWVSRSKVGLWLGVDAVLNIVRPRFVVDDLGSVFRTGVAAVRLSLGPMLRF